MYRLLLSTLALLSLTVLTTRSMAQPAEKKYALLVGVNIYDNRKFDDLKYAERDVEELSKVLAESGFEVRLLLGSKEGADQANKANIDKALAELLKKVTKRDIVLLSFAGHGVQPDTGKNAEAFFCPRDAVLGKTESLFSIGNLLTTLDNSGGAANLVLIDACRNDPDPSRGRGLDGNKVKNLPEGTAVMYSCRSGQKAYESPKAGGGHGVFFHFVIEGMRGAARNNRDVITWDGLTSYVRDSVESEFTSLVPGTDAAKQEPHEIKNLARRLVLTQKVALAPTVKRPKLLCAVNTRSSGACEITFVVPGSGADRIGMKTGDIITKINGIGVDSSERFLNSLNGLGVNDTLQIQIKRGNQTLDLSGKYATEYDEAEEFRRVSQMAEGGDAEAQYYLGSLYISGRGTEVDINKGMDWYAKSAEKGSPSGLYSAAYAYEYGRNGVARDLPKAYSMYLQAAQKDNSLAFHKVGTALEAGTGVGKDEQKALEWYRKGVDAHRPEAMVELGRCYEFGRCGLSVDKFKAVEYYNKAAELKSSIAIRQLARCQEYGIGGYTPDAKKAVDLYLKAADQKDPYAYYELGYHYALGRGVPLNDETAIQWYRKSADLGNSGAMVELGFKNQYGQGTEKNLQYAHDWYLQATNLNNALGMYYYATCLYNGYGCDKSPEKAVEWYQKSADLGESLSINEMGLLYREGKYLVKDDAKAFELFNKAAKLNLGDAFNNLGLCYENGEGTDKNLPKALENYRKSANFNNRFALWNVARFYEEGIVVPKDLNEAAKWYLKAGEAGHPDGKARAQTLGKSASNLKGKIEGTFWSSVAQKVGDNDVPVGAITIDFAANGSFVYKAGLMTWTGKYVLLEKDQIKLNSDQDLGGKRENLETILINGNSLTMIDPDGTTLKFTKVAPPAPPAPGLMKGSNLKGKIEGTRWKSLKGTAKDGSEIPAGTVVMEFTAKGGMKMSAGPETWEGKFVLGDGDAVTFNLDRELAGNKTHLQKIIITGKELKLIDTDGFTLKFEKIAFDD